MVGLFFTGVKLDTGVTGACATPLRPIPDAPAMPYSGKLCGRLARDLLKDIAAPSSIRRAVGIAAMNALADMCWERRPTAGVDLRMGVNAYDAAKIQLGENVVVVGAFVLFLKSLKRARHRFTVLEMDSATLKQDELQHFRPAGEAGSVVPDADVVTDHWNNAAQQYAGAPACVMPAPGSRGFGRSNGRSPTRCIPTPWR